MFLKWLTMFHVSCFGELTIAKADAETFCYLILFYLLFCSTLEYVFVLIVLVVATV